jgi:hypothetical protein
MTYNDEEEEEGVIGLGLGLGAAEKGNGKAVCPSSSIEEVANV